MNKSFSIGNYTVEVEENDRGSEDVFIGHRGEFNSLCFIENEGGIEMDNYTMKRVPKYVFDEIYSRIDRGEINY